jgi:pantoate--beta-alanine ligase
MRIESTIAGTRAACRDLRFGSALSGQRKTLGLVPTMGALHQGHLSLVRAARERCDTVAVSIFVNPTQFGPKEDLAKYPRPFAEDCALLEKENVDLLFAPTPEEMYPGGAAAATTFVTVEELSGRLDGASRPGHFRGVATVVAKLFNIIEPDAAFFGQKDAAQVSVLRRMVRDLNFGLELVVCPIVREPDGLAMSSRNRYLSAEERQSALVLSRTLLAVEQAAKAGERSSQDLLAAGYKILSPVLERNSKVRLDYFTVVSPDSLEPVIDVSHGALVAIAANVGSTRLIDNVLLPPQTS